MKVDFQNGVTFVYPKKFNNMLIIPRINQENIYGKISEKSNGDIAVKIRKKGPFELLKSIFIKYKETIPKSEIDAHGLTNCIPSSLLHLSLNMEADDSINIFTNAIDKFVATYRKMKKS